MNKRIVRLKLAAVLLVALLPTGCISTSPQVSYYSLYVSGQKPGLATADDNPLAISIGPVTIPDILRQQKIATGGADGHYRLAEYHRWSGELDREFARAIAEQLASTLGTERVAVFPWDQAIAPSCRVLVDILHMGGELGAEAVLEVRWAVIDPLGKRPQIVRRSEYREVPGGPGHPAWVVAQRRNVARLAREIADTSSCQ